MKRENNNKISFKRESKREGRERDREKERFKLAVCPRYKEGMKE